MQPFPDSLSDMIELGLKDLAAVMEQGVEIDFDRWIVRSVDQKSFCSVCFAGAVMMNTCQVDVGNKALDFLGYDPGSVLGRSRGHKLKALDSVRRGSLVNAVRIFYVDADHKPFSPQSLLDLSDEIIITLPFGTVHWYDFEEENFQSFVSNMQHIANKLREHGL